MSRLLQNYLSRHYHLTLLVLGISATALFKGQISGGDWVAVSTCAISAFRAGDAVDTWLRSGNNAGPAGSPK